MQLKVKFHEIVIVIYTWNTPLSRTALHERDMTSARNSREPINDACALLRLS